MNNTFTHTQVNVHLPASFEKNSDVSLTGRLEFKHVPM